VTHQTPTPAPMNAEARETLRRLAEQATKGPWVQGWWTGQAESMCDCSRKGKLIAKVPQTQYPGSGPFHVHETDFIEDEHALSSATPMDRVAGNYDYEEGGIINAHDAAYIAAANPAVVLALLDALVEAIHTAAMCGQRGDFDLGWRAMRDSLHTCGGGENPPFLYPCAACERERGDTPTARPACDHKFVDSTRCLKCGWEPATARPELSPLITMTKQRQSEIREYVRLGGPATRNIAEDFALELLAELDAQRAALAATAEKLERTERALWQESEHRNTVVERLHAAEAALERTQAEREALREALAPDTLSTLDELLECRLLTPPEKTAIRRARAALTAPASAAPDTREGS
jgi:hypothetical protein